MISRACALLFSHAVVLAVVFGCGGWWLPSLVHAAPGNTAAGDSSRAIKMELVDSLLTDPEVLWVGTSTSREINPAFIRAETGRVAFNGSLSGARTFDCYMMNRYITDHFAHQSHLIAGVDVEQFRNRPVIPWRERAAGSSPPALDVYDSLGFRVHNPKEDDNLDVFQTAATFRKKYATFHALDPGAKADFRDMVRTANRGGVVPVVVVMPVHPRLERLLADTGRADRRIELRTFFASLQHEGYAIRVLDASDPSLVSATERDFYDGNHMRPSGSRKLVHFMHEQGFLDRISAPPLYAG